MLLADVPIQRTQLPPGDAGINTTVATMARLAMGPYGARSPQIRELAIRIVNGAGTPNKNYRAQAQAIHNWMLSHISYIKDPVGQEAVAAPTYTVKTGGGDCDDMAALEAALLGSIGLTTRFVTVGMDPESFSHVYLHVNVPLSSGDGVASGPSVWIPLDPIMRDKPFGWEVPNPVRKKIFPENSAEGIPMNGLGHLFDTPIGSPVQNYIADPRMVHVAGDTLPASSGRSAPNYVTMRSMDADANSPTVMPPTAYENQDGTSRMELSGLGGLDGFRRGAGSIPGISGYGGGVPGVGNLPPTYHAGAAHLRLAGPTGPVRPYVNVQPLAVVPEGADAIFGRTLPIVGRVPSIDYGAMNMAERPPITPVSLSGLGEDAASPGDPGFGMPSQQDRAAAISSEVRSGGSKLLILAGVATIAYLLMRRK